LESLSDLQTTKGWVRGRAGPLLCGFETPASKREAKLRDTAASLRNRVLAMAKPAVEAHRESWKIAASCCRRRSP
jgi:hypothetical protein